MPKKIPGNEKFDGEIQFTPRFLEFQKLLEKLQNLYVFLSDRYPHNLLASGLLHEDGQSLIDNMIPELESVGSTVEEMASLMHFANDYDEIPEADKEKLRGGVAKSVLGKLNKYAEIFQKHMGGIGTPNLQRSLKEFPSVINELSRFLLAL